MNERESDRPLGERPILVALGGFLALTAAMGIGRFVYTPILPYMRADLGLTNAEGGFIASANFLGYLVGALLASSRSLPGERRAWFLGGLATSGVSTAAMALFSDLLPFLLLRFVGGVASAFVMVFAAALVLDRLAEARRAGLSAVHFAGVGNGIAVSAVLVFVIGAADHGWRQQWLWSGVVSLLVLAAVIRLVPRQPGSHAAAPPAVPPEGGVDRRFVALLIAYGLFGFGYVITATFISSMVRASAHLVPIEPVVWLTVGLTALPSVALWTRFGRRVGNVVAFAVASVVEAVGVALSVLIDDAAALLVSAALLGSTFMGLTALGLVHARALSSGDSRRGLGLMTASFGVGQVLGPAFAGLTADMGGGFLIPSLTASASLAAAAVLVSLRWPSDCPASRRCVWRTRR